MFKLFLLVTFVACCSGESKPMRQRMVCNSDGHYAPDPVVNAALRACGEGECVFKCQIKILGLGDENDRFVYEKLVDFINEVIPPEYIELNQKNIESCYAQYGPFDPNEDHCVHSKQFTDCVWKVLPQMTCDPNSHS